MTDAEYLLTQDQLIATAALTSVPDLDAFISRIARAESVGPMLDPSLYRAAGHRLAALRMLARAAREVQRTYGELVAEFEAASGSPAP